MGERYVMPNAKVREAVAELKSVTNRIEGKARLAGCLRFASYERIEELDGLIDTAKKLMKKIDRALKDDGVR